LSGLFKGHTGTERRALIHVKPLLPIRERDVSNDNQPATIAELKLANRELRDSLKRCQELVADCREKLGASSEASNIPAQNGARRQP
jgi:hypothetical protein